MSDREGAGRIKKQPRGGKRFMMKKTYKIEVDCANCALKMEEAAKKVDGVAEATEIGRASCRERVFYSV